MPRLQARLYPAAFPCGARDVGCAVHWQQVGGARAVQKFFFVMQGPERQIDDESGVVLSDRRSALLYAHELIDDLKSEPGFAYQGWKLIVKDELGEVIHSIPL
jgi:hypothetical protein